MAKPTCPRCNSKNQVKILYGLPRFDEEMEKDIDEGKIVLGGCSIDWDSPIWRCKDCFHKWGNQNEEFHKGVNQNG